MIHPETRFNCTRGCWISPGHGPIDLRRALAVSCNPYFEWIGEQVGFDAVVDAGECSAVPTTVVDFSDGTPTIVRRGAGDPARFE